MPVPYAAGELSAACVGGADSSSVSLSTAGPPAAIKLLADRPTIGATRDDLAYVTVLVVDAKGVLCDHAAVDVAFTASGAGELFRVGSGNPIDTDSFTNGKRTTWRGKAVAVLRPSKAAAAAAAAVAGGSITLTATAAGLTKGTVSVTVA